MLSLLVAVTLLSSDPAALYAASLQSALESVGAVHFKTERGALPASLTTATFTVRLDAEGKAVSLSTDVPTGHERADDLARSWIFAAEPFAPPRPELLDKGRRATCVIRLVITRGVLSTSPATAACFLPNDAVGFVAAPTTMTVKEDAGYHLLRGFVAERSGQLDEATRAYEASRALAPTWPLAARALGLVLVKQKRGGAALTHLRSYVDSQLSDSDAVVYAQEIARYEQERAEKAAAFFKPRRRLSQEDILASIKKGYALLEPCVARARDERLLAVGADTLVVTFRVQKDGGVDAARLEAPERLSVGEHAECVERVVKSWRFPPFQEGTDMTVKRLPIRVRGTQAQAVSKKEGSGARPVAEPVPDEPMFAQCERAPEELSRYIAERRAKLTACIEGERRRTKGAGWPERISVDFVADAGGPVRGVGIRHRAFRDGPLQTCVAQALAGTLAPADGADCPGEFSVELGAPR